MATANTYAPRRPPPSRRTLTLIVAPILVLLAMGWVGNAIHPRLIDPDDGHPLLLIALEPRNRWLILTADRIDFIPFLVVGTVRRLLSDPLFYLLGFLYGENAVRWAERKFDGGSGFIPAVERWFRKAAPVMVFLFPGSIVCVLAGATGMQPMMFAVLNVVGSLATVTALYFFAGTVEGPVDAITNFYGRNNRTLLIISIAFTALWFASQHFKGKGELESIDKIAETLEGDPPDHADEPR